VQPAPVGLLRDRSSSRHISAELHRNMLFLTTASAEGDSSENSGEQDCIFHDILSFRFQFQVTSAPRAAAANALLQRFRTIMHLRDSRRQSLLEATVSGIADQGWWPERSGFTGREMPKYNAFPCCRATHGPDEKRHPNKGLHFVNRMRHEQDFLGRHRRIIGGLAPIHRRPVQKWRVDARGNRLRCAMATRLGRSRSRASEPAARCTL